MASKFQKYFSRFLNFWQNRVSPLQAEKLPGFSDFENRGSVRVTFFSSLQDSLKYFERFSFLNLEKMRLIMIYPFKSTAVSKPISKMRPQGMFRRKQA